MEVDTLKPKGEKTKRSWQVLQTIDERCDAIKSLLPWIMAHLDHVPGAARVQRYGESEGGAGTPPLEPYTECTGRCHTCRAYLATLGKEPVCPPDERWVREARWIRRRYRIDDLEKSIMRLAGHDPTVAQAVWAVYVEPWPGDLLDPKRPQLGAKTEALSPGVRKERADLAEIGVRWMAHDLHGEIVAYGEQTVRREIQIIQLAEQGYTQRRIARELRCRPETVGAVLRALEGRSQRTDSAGG